MEEFDMLEAVKKDLGLSGNDFHDDTLQGHIDETMDYLIDGGIPETIVNSRKCRGLIKRGASDLWNNDSGGVDFSPYFMRRAAQIAMKYGVRNE